MECKWQTCVGYVVDAEPCLYYDIHKKMMNIEIWANFEGSKQHL